MTVIDERSINFAPAGIVTSAPTARMVRPSTRITWLRLVVPLSGSTSFPARIAVTWASAPTAESRNKSIVRNRLNIGRPFLSYCRFNSVQ